MSEFKLISVSASFEEDINNLEITASDYETKIVKHDIVNLNSVMAQPLSWSKAEFTSSAFDIDLANFPTKVGIKETGTFECIYNVEHESTSHNKSITTFFRITGSQDLQITRATTGGNNSWRGLIHLTSGSYIELMYVQEKMSGNVNTIESASVFTIKLVR